mmetsp:Transcript_41065/g.122597  ORF Transcript_41065/g.122597 Transcript_41065/m.122597 type:complete len:282 (-) Transcript_41065:896-1741(-)|eukprot:363453-Chlamydomonas_euryale.AAC.3
MLSRCPYKQLLATVRLRPHLQECGTTRGAQLCHEGLQPPQHSLLRPPCLGHLDCPLHSLLVAQHHALRLPLTLEVALSAGVDQVNAAALASGWPAAARRHAARAVILRASRWAYVGPPQAGLQVLVPRMLRHLQRTPLLTGAFSPNILLLGRLPFPRVAGALLGRPRQPRRRQCQGTCTAAGVAARRRAQAGALVTRASSLQHPGLALLDRLHRPHDGVPIAHHHVPCRLRTGHGAHRPQVARHAPRALAWRAGGLLPRRRRRHGRAGGRAVCHDGDPRPQ